jgi:hypothetical protein
MWAQCQDTDRTAALICHIQLSLCSISGAVIVSDTLAKEVRECFHTPAQHLEAWEYRLKKSDVRDQPSVKPEDVTVEQ